MRIEEKEIFDAHHNIPTSPRYNLGAREEIKGDLDVERYLESVSSIISEEEAFSYRFIEDSSGTYKERLINENYWDIETFDLSQLSESDLKKEVERISNEIILTPFELQSPPLYRLRVLSCSFDRFFLIHAWHHIIMDGKGFNLFHQRVNEQYNGIESPFKKVASDDVECKVSRYWNSERRRKDEVYWKDFVRKPLDFLRPNNRLPSLNPTQRKQCKLSRELWEKLESKSESNIQFYLMLAIQLCFSDSLGRKGITFGIPTHRRTDAKSKNEIAHFAGLSLVKSQVQPSDSIKDALKKLKEHSKKSYKHQRYPLANLIRELAFKTNQQNQFYDVLFSFETMPFYCNYGDSNGKIYGLCNQNELSPVSIYYRKNNRQEPPVIDIKINKDYFNHVESDTLTHRFLSILTYLSSSDESTTIRDIPILSKDEIRKYSQLKKTIEPHSNLFDKIDYHSDKTPNKTAVIDCNGHSYSYQKLSQDIRVVASNLQSLGITTNSRVALYFSRNYEMLVLMLATNWLGASYTPVSLDQPAVRASFIFEQLDPTVIVTDSEPCPSSAESTYHYSQFFEQNTRNESDRYRGTYRAYILFTSGSTGQPKGVSISNTARDHFLNAVCKKLSLDNTCIIPSLASASFDISILEMFAPIFVGAKTLLLKEKTQSSARQLAKLLNLHSPTHIQATPTAWLMLLETDWTPSPNSVAIIGGEAVPQELIKSLQNAGMKCWNAYGPTESTVWVMLHEIETLSCTDPITPIGGLLDGCQAYVYDEHQRLLPPHALGELILSGKTLAEDYFKQREKTKEAFFVNQRGERCYRTGDIVRLRDDGNFDFIGRKDNQCKIDGYRIELGEIENVILSHSKVSRAAVLVVTKNQNKQLIGFISNHSFDDEFKKHLESSLPNHMIPKEFIRVWDWPSNTSGKTDRNALINLYKAMPKHPTQKVNSSKNADTSLVERCWETILGHLSDPHMNFFDAGGNSYKALMLQKQIESELGCTLSDTFVFENPTLETMKKVISDQRNVSPTHSTSTVPVKSKRRPTSRRTQRIKEES
ncbi:amino acid adenylation domain-containing protein [Vibrio penaeicida]|uniref:amino acid adenylation domain-containing protein n=1 Tax=Vibrio penaeicida TaxID=104609 RepID=UPI001CC74763|nr:amino acid adenylation domain-containing protein [Vibrio penaeicida]